jgi:outer membrane protein assembly factor BamB/tetratricopeptide (TPR) repeat protein
LARVVSSLLSAFAASAVTALVFAPAVRAQEGAGAFEAGRDGEDERATQLFALNGSREAEGLARRAAEALAGGRTTAAFAAFVELASEHRGEVLPPNFGPQVQSQYEFRIGVEAWVLARLQEQSTSVRASWSAWSLERAGAVLEFARRTRDSAVLRELARVHPLSSVGARAELALGDLASSEGRVLEAERAFERAARSAQACGDEAAEASALQRVAALAALVREPVSSGDDVAPSTEAELPRGPLHEWIVELPRDTPFASNRPSAGTWALVGAVRGDRVYVSTTLEVLCFDLLSGTPLFGTERPAGWERVRQDERREFFDAIDHADAVVEPAVDERVVVAALQIPESKNSSYDYQGITVTSRIPERRLFAFDATTGAKLWDHAPGSGVCPEAEGLSVCAPPLLVEGRLYVPCARVEGRIELRVLCCDPATGVLLWSTRVVSGQRALNMFNRHEEEFWSAPLAVHDGALIVGTQLGSVAALDLASGACLWQATYEPLPLPRNRSFYSAAPRRRVWRNAAPVVSDGVVLAAPTDCEDLVAIDFASGRVVWSMPNRLLEPDRTTRLSVDLLLGARGDAFVLGGGWIASWRHASGLADAAPLERGGLAVALPEEIVLQAGGFATGPRAALVGDRVLVPSSAGLLVLDMFGERREDEEIEWDHDAQGNVLVARGAVVSVRGDRVLGHLDIAILEARTMERLARDPRDLGALETAARILLRRAEVAREDGDDAEALVQHEKLRATIEERLDASPALRALYAEAVLQEALLLGKRGASGEATALLAASTDRVREDELALSLLVAWFELERERDAERALAVLNRVEQRVPNAEVAVVVLATDSVFVDWLRLEELRPLPAAMWAAIQRALIADTRDDARAAVAAWQAALERFGDEELARGLQAKSAFELAIAGWLVRAPDAYEPFERAARSALDAALPTRDVAALDELVRRHPFAAAAREARELAVDWALESGDLAAALARGRDSGGGDEVWTTPRRVALALLADAAGNGSLARSLLNGVARTDADWRATSGAARGLSAEELVTLVVNAEPLALPRASFGETVRLVDTVRGPFDVVGYVTDDDDEGLPRLLVHRREHLEALPLSSDVAAQRTPFSIGSRFPGEQQRTLAREALVWSSSGRLYGTDLTTGRERWQWPPDDDGESRVYQIVQESAAGDGVAVATVYRVPQPSTAVAIELVTGEVLWEIDMPIGVRYLRPIVADGRAIFVSHGVDGLSSVVSVDLLTGGDRVDFQLGAALDARDGERLAVRAGRLIVPLFDDGALEAHDITTGERAWRHDFAAGGARTRLFALVEHNHALFAITSETDVTSGGTSRVHEIEARLGGTRVVAALDPGEVLVGVPTRSWKHLESPHLFTLWHDGSSAEARLSLLSLPLGRTWTAPLRLADGTLADVSRTLPVVSGQLVALVWGTVDPETGRGDNPRLGFFDLSSGTKITHRLLPQDFADFDDVELLGLGDALWIVCSSRDENEERIEIWR